MIAKRWVAAAGIATCAAAAVSLPIHSIPSRAPAHRRVGLQASATAHAARRASGALLDAVGWRIITAAGAFGTQPLSLGDAGAAVRTLQADLKRLGYQPGLTAGIFTPATGRAVRLFQWVSHLPTTGIASRATADALLQQLGGAAGAQRPRPTAAAALTAQKAFAAKSHTPTAPAAPAAPTAPAAPASTPGPLVLGYYTQYSPSSQASQDSLAAHASQVTAIAPLWYSLRANASLHDLGYHHAAVRAWAHAHGVAVCPLVINGYANDAILLNPALRAASVAELARLAVQDGYAGFNIDFEGLSNADETGLDAFVAQLAAALHPLGKKVIVAVGPRTSSTNGYHVYNYRVLGQVADAVVLMTYDHHDIGSPAGPVAPIGWVQQIVRYALSEMPAQKIVLGLAVYGYNWSSTGTTAEIHDPQAAPLAQQRGVPIQWSTANQEAHFTYTAASGAVHQVWYENSRSDALKVALANQDHLGGVAIWRLGDETPAFWQVLRGLR